MHAGARRVRASELEGTLHAERDDDECQMVNRERVGDAFVLCWLACLETFASRVGFAVAAAAAVRGTSRSARARLLGVRRHIALVQRAGAGLLPGRFIGRCCDVSQTKQIGGELVSKCTQRLARYRYSRTQRARPRRGGVARGRRCRRDD